MDFGKAHAAAACAEGHGLRLAICVHAEPCGDIRGASYALCEVGDVAAEKRARVVLHEAGPSRSLAPEPHGVRSSDWSCRSPARMTVRAPRRTLCGNRPDVVSTCTVTSTAGGLRADREYESSGRIVMWPISLGPPASASNVRPVSGCQCSRRIRNRTSYGSRTRSVPESRWMRFVPGKCCATSSGPRSRAKTSSTGHRNTIRSSHTSRDLPRNRIRSHGLVRRDAGVRARSSSRSARTRSPLATASANDRTARRAAWPGLRGSRARALFTIRAPARASDHPTTAAIPSHRRSVESTSSAWVISSNRGVTYMNYGTVCEITCWVMRAARARVARRGG